MKILNLYAGIGGNRKLWGNEHDITAVELRPEIAALPNSKPLTRRHLRCKRTKQAGLF